MPLYAAVCGYMRLKVRVYKTRKPSKSPDPLELHKKEQLRKAAQSDGNHAKKVNRRGADADRRDYSLNANTIQIASAIAMKIITPKIATPAMKTINN